MNTVIFDMDGVLIDTEKYLVTYWCQAAKEFGFDMKREHGLLIRSLAGIYAEPKLKELLGESFDYQKVRSRRKQLMEEQLKKSGIEKKPGVDILLNFLKTNGFKTAVATATDETRAKAYLSEIGILYQFDKVICATMVERGKPMPDIYLYACQQLEENPCDCYAIEDSPNGILAAVRAGLKTIMVPDLTQPDEQLFSILYAKADSLEQVIDLIKADLSYNYHF